MTARFEERLLTELQHVVAERPSPVAQTTPTRRSPRRRLVLAGAAVAATTAVAVVVATGGGAPSSAYAVEPAANGAVTVHISSLRDAAGLEQSLRDAGVPAVVRYAPSGTPGACTAPSPPKITNGVPANGQGFQTGGTPGGPGDPGPTLEQGGAKSDTAHAQTIVGGSTPPPAGGPDTAHPGAMSAGVMVEKGGGVTFTVNPGTIKDGQKLYVTTSDGKLDSIGMAIGTGDHPVCAGGPTP